MLAASGSKTKVVQDPVVLRLQSLQETYSASAVEAARIALGIPAEEIHAKEDFTNKYDAKLTDPSEFRKEYVPEDRSPRLKQRKKELWNFKRELHLDAIEDVLTGHRNAPMPKLRETGQKRYHLAQQQVGEGGDISSPPAPDMSEFDAAMAIRNQQIKEEFEKRQAKRAELMIQAIADSERKMQYAEQKARESKARLDAYKKELKVAQKEKAKAIQERMQACLNAAAAAHKAHMAEARETYNKLVSRLDRAQTYRDNKLDPTALKASSDKSLAMTQHRLKNAKDKMSRTCDELQHRQALADKKLAEQKEEIRLKIEAQIVAAQEKFAKIQADVQETLERQAKERLEKHENFENHYAVVASNRKQFLKERSELVQQKRSEKMQTTASNRNSLANEVKGRQQSYENRSRHMDSRVSYVKDLRLKNGMDVFTHNEQKYETFGALQQRNYAAKLRSIEMAKTCSLLKVAETRAKAEAKEAQFQRAMDIKNQMFRELSAKQERLSMTKDPKKLAEVMQSMGMKVPAILRPGGGKKQKEDENK